MYIACYIYVRYHVLVVQLGLLPEMDREAPGLFTARERIVQDFAKEKRVDATLSRISYKRCCTTLTLILTKWITTGTSSSWARYRKVTFKSLISRKMVTVSKKSGCSRDQQARSLESCWRIQDCVGASTLPSRSTRTLAVLESLAATPMDQFPFSWPS